MQLKDIENIRTKAPYGFEYTFWEDFTAKIIDRIFGNESVQRHGFEQAGRGDCFSVFETCSDQQRRENFMEILNFKKEYLKNLIDELEAYRKKKEISAADGNKDDPDDGGNETNIFGFTVPGNTVLSPLDRTIGSILEKVKNREAGEEAGKKLRILRDELLKPNPSWPVVKSSMAFLLELGRDEFFAILPFIVLYHRKIVD
ncbi:MAG: hypothetical protein K6T80_00475 [Firmicutes bacterium]|nr:hypothetical protein [Bacillota bacterium]